MASDPIHHPLSQRKSKQHSWEKQTPMPVETLLMKTMKEWKPKRSDPSNRREDSQGEKLELCPGISMKNSQKEKM